MRALTLERWADDPGPDTADPSALIPHSFTWTDTADPTDLRPYAFTWKDPPGDTADPDWGAGLGSMAKGAAMGGALGTAVGTIFPGIGNVVGGAVGTVAGAIGGFFAGAFGGGKPKPTPTWVIDVLEDGRRALQEVPPNPSKMLDAVLVTSGKLSQEGYLRAKMAGELPSQKFDRNRPAAMAKARAMDKRFGPQIAENLKGLSLPEKALVSAALPLGQGKAAMDALRSIRAQMERANQPRPKEKPFFSLEALDQLRQQYIPESLSNLVTDIAPKVSSLFSGADTSGPIATPHTLEDLPKPLWHVAPPVMPRHHFEKLLRAVPILRQLPEQQLRALAGLESQVQDTSGIDAVAHQYVMTPGETFAGIAAQLTGDASRAPELHAANPDWTPDQMRLDIPPGWIEWTPLWVKTSTDTAGPGFASVKGDIPPEVTPGQPLPPPGTPAEKPAGKPVGKDGVRANLTKRVITVRAGDWPEKIASRTGAKSADPQWFKTLKSANPHKALASNGNFQTLLPGELLNYPDTWPQHEEAKPAPGMGGSPAPGADRPPEVTPGPALPPAGKDGIRANLTKRVIAVRAGDWPEKIASRVGAKDADPQWFKTLKSVNPHKALADDGNFKTLLAGELLNYPDTWPQHEEAKPAPGAGGSPTPGANLPPGVVPPEIVPGQPAPPPGTVPAGATANKGTMQQAQAMLAQFAIQHPDVAVPNDFGKIGDFTGAPTDRTRSILRSFQGWWNAKKPPQALNEDGVLDPPSMAALQQYSIGALVDYFAVPTQPNQGGGGTPNPSNQPPSTPGDNPQPSGGDTPSTPGTVYIPWSQPNPPPRQKSADNTASTSDDGAAALMVGGTVLSFLLR